MISIYTDKHCPYCKELKIGLNKLKIEFTEIDIDLPRHKDHANKIFKLLGEVVIPVIAIPPHLLAPKRSFNTIDEALKLISNLNKK